MTSSTAIPYNEEEEQPYIPYDEQVVYPGLGTLTKVWYFTTTHQSTRRPRRDQKLQIRYSTYSGFWQMILNGKLIKEPDNNYSPFSLTQLSFELGINQILIRIEPEIMQINHIFELTMDGERVDDVLESDIDDFDTSYLPFLITIVRSKTILKNGEPKVMFRIQTTGPAGRSLIDRRYSEFTLLDTIIKSMLPDYYIDEYYPDLPEKCFNPFKNQIDPIFIRNRRNGLEKYLQRLAITPKVRSSPDFLIFLGLNPVTGIPIYPVQDSSYIYVPKSPTIERKPTLTPGEVKILTGEIKTLKKKLSKLKLRREREKEKENILKDENDEFKLLERKDLNDIPNIPMKAFFWNMLPHRIISKSIWNDLDDRDIDIDIETLEFLFGKHSIKNIKNENHHHNDNNINHSEKLITKKSFRIKSKTMEEKIIKIQNSLQSLDMTPDEIRQSLLTVDKNLLTINNLNTLLQITPLVIEIQDSNLEKTTLIDMFITIINEIPDFQGRLSSLLYVLKFENNLEKMYDQLDIILQATNKMKESNDLKIIFEYIMTFGNYLNYGTSRGNAYGFHLDTLQKLTNLKSNNNKYTLLDILIMNIDTYHKDTLNITKELEIVHKAAHISLENMSDDLGTLLQGLEQLKEQIILSEQNHIDGDEFISIIKPFLKKASKDLNDLQGDFQSTSDDFNELLKLFGEINNNMSSSDFFMIMSNFLRGMVTSILRSVNSF